MSYLEGIIVACANTQRSYIIEAQGHRYRHNRPIRPINTDPPSPHSRPYTHATPQSHNNSTISGPQNISRPPQPLTEPKVVWNTKMPTLNGTPIDPLTSYIKQPTTPIPIPDPTQPNQLTLLILPFQDLCHRLNYALISYSHTLSPSVVSHSPQQKTTLTHPNDPHHLQHVHHCYVHLLQLVLKIPLQIHHLV